MFTTPHAVLASQPESASSWSGENVKISINNAYRSEKSSWYVVLNAPGAEIAPHCAIFLPLAWVFLAPVLCPGSQAHLASMT